MTLETEGQKTGIQDVGVVFQYSELPKLDEEMPTEEKGVEISTDEPENGIETETTNTTPGFSALTLLIMIFMLWRFKSN
jgi:hypothetical protein